MKHHTIDLSESAFAGFQRRAESAGLSVTDYLNHVGSTIQPGDSFVLTPDIRAAIQDGIDQADRGELASLEQAISDLHEFKAQWRAESRHS